MKEYIERESLIAEYDRRYYPIRIGEPPGARKLIENAPTADVVEVKHGEWKQTTEPLGYHDVDCVECSACGESWVLEGDFELEDYKTFWLYCPRCGARMDGGESK